MKKQNLVIESIKYILATAVISFLFYDSIYAFLIFLPFIKLYLYRQKRRFYEEIVQKLENQFCEMIGSLSTSLSAGLSPENSFINARKDMIKLYGDNSIIVREMNEIITGYKYSIPLTEGLKSLAEKANSDDIKDFVVVFTEALKSGGSLVLIIKNTVAVMQEKRQIEKEISAMLKGKLLEQKIICIIPFLIFLYLRLSSRDFISVLYHNTLGVVVMTVCLALYIGSVLLSEKIVNISV